MRRLRYTAGARRDLDRISIYIARESGSRAVAASFAGKLREKCRYIASLPGLLGTARPDIAVKIRSTPLGSYVIFFRYGATAVDIINILNARQDVIAYLEDMTERADD